jgi:hypothetical protein
LKNRILLDNYYLPGHLRDAARAVSELNVGAIGGAS